MTLYHINPSLGTKKAYNYRKHQIWTNSIDIPYPLSKLSNSDDDVVTFYFSDVIVVVIFLCFTFPL